MFEFVECHGTFYLRYMDWVVPLVLLCFLLYYNNYEPRWRFVRMSQSLVEILDKFGTHLMRRKISDWAGAAGVPRREILEPRRKPVEQLACRGALFLSRGAHQ